MDAVEKDNYPHPVIVGLGTKEQAGALLTAGAEKVFDWSDWREDLLRTAGASIRAGDTVLMVQPKVIRLADLSTLISACGGDLDLMVAGREPTRDVNLFRSQKADVPATIVPATTGRPAKLKATIEQADALIRLWHSDRKPAEIATLADAILGVPNGTVKPHWVRDLVKKYVGTAQREKPKRWRGVRID